MIEKKTDYRKYIEERDVKIKTRFDELIADGYMKGQAAEVLMDEFGFHSSLGIRNAIERGRKLLEAAE